VVRQPAGFDQESVTKIGDSSTFIWRIWSLSPLSVLIHITTRGSYRLPGTGHLLH
jgi:hypothetical protein